MGSGLLNFPPSHAYLVIDPVQISVLFCIALSPKSIHGCGNRLG